MNDFNGFSEAARLYAKYINVVQEMEEAFKGSITAFLNSVRDEIKDDVDSRVFKEETSPKYRSWWFENDKMVVKSFEPLFPYVFFKTTDSSIVDPGVLTIYATLEELSDGNRRRFVTAKGKVKLPDSCRFVESRELFAIEIHYGKSDPVSAVAGPVRAALDALYEVAQTILAEEGDALPIKQGKRA